ncbi:TetR/AcrR family transcriptional regulator [Actinomadura rugatobispora]|uniref:TetR/AcrR family transcriptional regulator n=1 Tax=Actinomadura rugatobispora TaxID=1994 RepID=A0ABW1ADP4_9ACTN|nr:TetR/AcrR family transcriptional regulator [Actinomadura rugatobispora]
MRADARRNRERIAAAALRLFAERGAAASMEEVARAAEVGVGTLYRHFPDRRALLDEIAVTALDRLLGFGREVADEAEAAGEAGRGAPEGPDATPHWDALVRFVEYCTLQPLALVKQLSGGTSANPDRHEKERASDALIAELAGRAQKEGTLRGDLAPDEVVAVLSAAVCRPGARFDDPLTRVMLDGLRNRAPG